MKNIIAFILLFFSIKLSAQEFKSIQFVPSFKTELFQIQKEYLLNGNTIKLTNFKFYISNLNYYYNDSLIYTSAQPVYLIDGLDSNSLFIKEKIKLSFNNIKFNIGIDSLTNTVGALEGALDPTTGMYWTWQSGYINFKLEGVASNCPARYHKFYWHIGGYKDPFNALRNVVVTSKHFTSSAKIEINLADLFEKIDVAKTYQVMSPNPQSVQIANELPSLFNLIE